MEEYTPEFSNIPDINGLIQQRINSKKGIESPPPGKFDPYKAMVKRNRIEKGEELATVEDAPKWPEKDIQELQDYCRRMGIVGFSTRQNPKLALMKLKQQVGDMSEIPLESRVPYGYQSIGSSKKTILKG